MFHAKRYFHEFQVVNVISEKTNCPAHRTVEAQAAEEETHQIQSHFIMETIEDNTTPEPAPTMAQTTIPPSEEENCYTVLGLIPGASSKQIEASYKKLALKYQPERNENSEVASGMLESVSNAYKTLIDPEERKKYDEAFGFPPAASSEGLAMGMTQGFGRVFGAVISRFGIPISTTLSLETIEAAQAIARGGTLDGGGGPPLDPRVSDLTWGWPAEGKAERQSIAYYRLTVDSRQIENGFVLHCKSPSKGKFKLIVMDQEGNLVFQEDSLKAPRDPKAAAVAMQTSLFFTAFDTYELGDPQPASAHDKDTPSLFYRLEGLASTKRSIAPGQYLVCVYGDNYIGRTNFSILAVPAKNDAHEVVEIEETDESLVEAKVALEALQIEYTQAKAAYDGVLKKMKEESDKVDLLIQARDKSYSGFLLASAAAFAPISAPTDEKPASNTTTTPATASDGKPAADSPDTAPVVGDAAAAGDGAVLGSETGSAAEGTGVGANGKPPSPRGSAIAATLSAATSTARDVGAKTAANAAATATLAGGWLSKRLSGTVDGLQSIVMQATAPAPSKRASDPEPVDVEAGAGTEGFSAETPDAPEANPSTAPVPSPPIPPTGAIAEAAAVQPESSSAPTDTPSAVAAVGGSTTEDVEGEEVEDMQQTISTSASSPAAEPSNTTTPTVGAAAPEAVIENKKTESVGESQS